MRTTLAIDDDVLEVARRLAVRENRSLGEIVSELARVGLNTRRRQNCAAPATGSRCLSAQLTLRPSHLN
jgi:hypothetical protein